MENSIIFPLIPLFIGVAFLLVGFLLLRSNRKIQTNGIKTQAKITDYVKGRLKRDNSYYDVYYPVITFTDDKGIKTTQELNISFSEKRSKDLLEIIYLKKGNEFKILIDSAFWRIYFPLIFIIIGLITLVFGVVWLIYLK